MTPGEKLAGRVGGAVTLAVGMSKVFSKLPGMGTLTVGRPWRATLYESDKPSIAMVEAAGRRLGSGKLTAVHRDLFRNPLMAVELDAFDADVVVQGKIVR